MDLQKEQIVVKGDIMKMNKNEFEKWVDSMNNAISHDSKAKFITMTSDKTVLAYNVKTLKSAMAKCHPHDEFCLKTGKAIAYARLKGIEVPKVDEEPEFKRAKRGDTYYYIIRGTFGNFEKSCTRESNCSLDTRFFENNNYFHTKERAEEVADKINFLLKLERLHDIYCPDYKPDWDNKDEEKYFVYFDHYVNIFVACDTYVTDKLSVEYFPTEEIAQKVCEILNKEAGIQSLPF